MATPFIGQIRMFGFNFPPRGNALCNGQLLPINQNQALFSLLGTTYGGNGTTNFGLPQMQSRVPLHFGSGFVQGQVAGVETVTLTPSQMPAHSHTALASAAAPAVGVPTSNDWATGGAAAYAPAADTTMAGTALGTGGGSQPHENRMPSAVVNFCIALTGIFPSRN
jgi:microcystin-dependent protein